MAKLGLLPPSKRQGKFIFFCLHYHCHKAVIAAKQNYSVITFIQQMDEIVMCESITGKNLQFILFFLKFLFQNWNSPSRLRGMRERTEKAEADHQSEPGETRR